MPLGLGFFLENGQKALHLRSIFAKCFYSEKMFALTPKIVEIIQNHFKRISAGFKDLQEEFPQDYELLQSISNPLLPAHKFNQLDLGESTDFKSVNFRSILMKVFSEFVDEIVFGTKNYTRFEGYSLPEATELMFRFVSMGSIKHPLNSLSGGLLAKYKLIEPIKKAWKLSESIRKIITFQYAERSKIDIKNLGTSVMDLMVLHNKTA